MRKTWTALILGALLCQSAAQAQFPLGPGSPGQPGQAPVGQTMPGDPGLPTPPMPPGVVSPVETPDGAPDVPRFGDPAPTNAFDGGGPAGSAGPGFVLNLGVIALRRETIGNATYAVYDPGVVLPPFPPFFDHGGSPPPGSPSALSLSDLNPQFGYGVKGSLTFFGEASLFEISGYYIPRAASNATASAPSRLDLPFANSLPPLGFEGDNGMWLQADQVRLTLENEIINLEMNVHYASSTNFNGILGVRFFDLTDSFSIFTDDDGLTVRPPDPTTQATYRATSHTRLLGPQLGMQMRFALDEPDVFMTASLLAVPGINFNEVEISLTRGDGFEGPSGRRQSTQFTQLLEFNLGLEFTLTERIWFRAGYQALLLLNVPVSYDQVNFDPGNTDGTRNDNGMVLFHGPMAMLQF